MVGHKTAVNNDFEIGTINCLDGNNRVGEGSNLTKLS